MNLLKSLWVAVAMAAVAVSEPALPGQYEYLPPDKGYKYPTPSITFQPSPPPPNTTPYRPPQTSYRPPATPPPPFVTRPPVVTPPPTRPPFTVPPGTYPPPVTSPPFSPTYTPPTRPPYGPTPGHHDHVHVPGMPFDFEYAVKDDAHGADYAHRANSNGDVVQGEYRNLLPDGRVQVVRYTADWATGFHAEVTYQGEARYPAPAPAPVYGPPQQQQQPPQQTGY